MLRIQPHTLNQEGVEWTGIELGRIRKKWSGVVVLISVESNISFFSPWIVGISIESTATSEESVEAEVSLVN